jgi:hypothetical protein
MMLFVPQEYGKTRSFSSFYFMLTRVFVVFFILMLKKERS